jgi:hypothetical protein
MEDMGEKLEYHFNQNHQMIFQNKDGGILLLEFRSRRIERVRFIGKNYYIEIDNMKS